MHYFKAIGEFESRLQYRNTQFGSKLAVPCDIEIWWMTITIGHLLCYFKLCASIQSHRWIQTGVTVRKRSIWGNISDFLSHVTLKFDGWPWNKAPLLCCFNLCASCHSHLWVQTGVTVRKHTIWVKIDDVFSCLTLKFGGWPWKTIGHLS